MSMKKYWYEKYCSFKFDFKAEMCNGSLFGPIRILIRFELEVLGVLFVNVVIGRTNTTFITSIQKRMGIRIEFGQKMTHYTSVL
jgi:hypothetical protein